MVECVHVDHVCAQGGTVYCVTCEAVIGHWHYNDPDTGDFRIVIESHEN